MLVLLDDETSDNPLVSQHSKFPKIKKRCARSHQRLTCYSYVSECMSEDDAKNYSTELPLDRAAKRACKDAPTPVHHDAFDVGLQRHEEDRNDAPGGRRKKHKAHSAVTDAKAANNAVRPFTALDLYCKISEPSLLAFAALYAMRSCGHPNC